MCLCVCVLWQCFLGRQVRIWRVFGKLSQQHCLHHVCYRLSILRTGRGPDRIQPLLAWVACCLSLIAQSLRILTLSCGISQLRLHVLQRCKWHCKLRFSLVFCLFRVLILDYRILVYTFRYQWQVLTGKQGNLGRGFVLQHFLSNTQFTLLFPHVFSTVSCLNNWQGIELFAEIGEIGFPLSRNLSPQFDGSCIPLLHGVHQ